MQIEKSYDIIRNCLWCFLTIDTFELETLVKKKIMTPDFWLFYIATKTIHNQSNRQLFLKISNRLSPKSIITETFIAYVNPFFSLAFLHNQGNYVKNQRTTSHRRIGKSKLEITDTKKKKS